MRLDLLIYLAVHLGAIVQPKDRFSNGQGVVTQNGRFVLSRSLLGSLCLIEENCRSYQNLWVINELLSVFMWSCDYLQCSTVTTPNVLGIHLS